MSAGAVENVDVMLRSDISVRCAGKREIFDRYRHVKMGNACLNGDILCPVVANGTKTVHNARILDSSEEHEDIFFMLLCQGNKPSLSSRFLTNTF